jgi:hypothetical protein
MNNHRISTSTFSIIIAIRILSLIIAADPANNLGALNAGFVRGCGPAQHVHHVALDSTHAGRLHGTHARTKGSTLRHDLHLRRRAAHRQTPIALHEWLGRGMTGRQSSAVAKTLLAWFRLLPALLAVRRSRPSPGRANPDYTLAPYPYPSSQ